MCNAARFTHHSRLLTRMADAMGLDMETKCQTGDLPPEVFDTLVFDCLGCTRPGACEAKLDNLGGERIAAAPAYCRNADTLAALAKNA